MATSTLRPERKLDAIFEWLKVDLVGYFNIIFIITCIGQKLMKARHPEKQKTFLFLRSFVSSFKIAGNKAESDVSFSQE